MAAFQWLNPKAWVLVSSVAAAAATLPADAARFAPAAALGLFVALSALCLACWAIAGRAASNWLRDTHRRRAFELAMGVVLLVSALSLALRAAGGAA